MSDGSTTLLGPAEAPRAPAETEIVEVPLLLPAWQVKALAQAAQEHGMTAAAVVRALVHEFLAGRAAAGPLH
jgi:hypothetical protein